MAKEVAQIRIECDVPFCLGFSIIGMTTTSAAKNRELIEALRLDTIVVEEAAEVLEAHIITSLTDSVERLVLVGDHHQLRPTINVYVYACVFFSNNIMT